MTYLSATHYIIGYNALPKVQNCKIKLVQNSATKGHFEAIKIDSKKPLKKIKIVNS